MRVRYYNSHLKEKARQLCKNQSEAEKLLWSKLRNRQLNNFKFQRQFPIGQYVADFVCRNIDLIIEVDGGQHNEYSSQIYDNKRTQYFNQLGYKVLRFWNNDIMNNIEGVLQNITEEVNSHPDLLSRREGN